MGKNNVDFVKSCQKIKNIFIIVNKENSILERERMSNKSLSYIEHTGTALMVLYVIIYMTDIPLAFLAHKSVFWIGAVCWIGANALKRAKKNENT